MKILYGIAAAVVLLIVAVMVAAAMLLDPDDFREPLQAQLADALGRDVTLGEMDVSLFPIPAVRVREIRLGPDAPGLPDLAQVAELRLRPAILPLLFGRVVLAAVEIAEPSVQLAIDDAGLPIPPTLPDTRATPGASGARGGARDETPAPDATPAEAGVALAIQSIRVSGGAVTAGPWRVENLDVDGSLAADGTGRFSIDADVAELARLRGVDVDLSGLGGDAIRAALAGRLEDVQIGGAAERFPVIAGSSGTLQGDFSATVQGEEVREAALHLSGDELELAADDLAVVGRAALKLQLGGPWSVDLTDALVTYGDGFQKPRGIRARATGELPGLPPERLERVQIELAGESISLDVDLSKASPRVGIASGRLDLAALQPLVAPELEGLAGVVALRDLAVQVSPLDVRGALELDGISVPQEDGPVSVSGPLRASGNRIATDGLDVSLGGETLRVAGRYEIPTDQLYTTVTTTDADLEALVVALSGVDTIGGRLALRFDLSVSQVMGADTLAPQGSGRLEVREGRLRGFSLLRDVLGELAAVPILLARMKGRDLSRFEQEEFESLTGDFALRQQRLETGNLTIRYRHATAELEGWLNVLSGALNMRGRILLHEEVDAELVGQPTGKRKVIPIEAIGGTIQKPRVQLDKRVVGQIASGYIASDRVREKLEEKLGPGGAEMVDDVLRGIFGGGKRKEEESAP